MTTLNGNGAMVAHSNIPIGCRIWIVAIEHTLLWRAFSNRQRTLQYAGIVTMDGAYFTSLSVRRMQSQAANCQSQHYLLQLRCMDHAPRIGFIALGRKNAIT